MTDDSGTPSLAVAVYSNEADDAPMSDGNFSPDAKGAIFDSTSNLYLRSERAGGGGGRVYLIVVTATDAGGLTDIDCCTTYVPADQSNKSTAAAAAKAAAALDYCQHHGGAAPADSFQVGLGPIVGPKQ